MKKIFFLFVFALGLVGLSGAVPAIKKPVTVMQADGTTITVYIRGDESTRWSETLDGYSLLRKDGLFYYAVKNEKGEMVASDVRAHDQDARTRQEKRFLRKIPKKLRFSAEQVSRMRSRGPAAAANDAKRTGVNAPLAKTFKARKSITDTVVRRAPVILVNFADLKMKTSKAQYEELIGKENYTENDCTGSFRDYFLDNSRGLFRFEADVIGPIDLSESMAYYGYDESNVPDMVAEACRAAAAQGVDFSQYDFDNDGEIDGVHVIFPGQGEEVTGDEDAIWSHMWNVWEEVSLNGKILNVYSCSAEFSYTYDWAYIGTLVHELSHVFGLPDLYDTDYENGGGQAVTPGDFDVMDQGSYNNFGKTPPLHNAWSRMEMGWLEPVELTEACSVEIYEAQKASYAFMYRTPVWGEYFVLDYRGEESRWDAGIPGYGMLIFAVNKNLQVDYNGYDVPAWDYNCVNCNPFNRGFYIKQANGGDASTANMGLGTPFPGRYKNTSFTDDTSPSSLSHDGKPTKKPITDITLIEGGVRFQFMGGGDKVLTNTAAQAAAPEFDPDGGEVAEGTQVHISTATEGATIHYTLDGSIPTSASDVYAAPIVITRNITIKAVAIKAGIPQSVITEATYTIKTANAVNPFAELKVYPNPNNGNLYVELPVQASVEVFGANGTLVRQHRFTAGRHALQISDRGNYLLRFSAQGVVTTKKITVL